VLPPPFPARLQAPPSTTRIIGTTVRTDIVVIDDDPSMRILLEETLAIRGFPVQVFASGQEAIEGADWARAETLLVDWMMPGMSGLEVAAWAAETHPEIRRMILTAAPEALRDTRPDLGDLALVIGKGDLPGAMFDALEPVSG
jgi:CheY-like chemotaxis protein